MEPHYIKKDLIRNTNILKYEWHMYPIKHNEYLKSLHGRSYNNKAPLSGPEK